MSAPPHPGARWADPSVQLQRRQEIEKRQREIGAHFARMTAEQEAQQNDTERERFLQQQRR
jgi:hypothetical protein